MNIHNAALLLTDVVDSTKLAEALGDARMATLWAAHDRIARDLLPQHRGREIDKTDGMLLLFDAPEDAVHYAGAYHRGLAALSKQQGVRLAARAGLHVGEIHVRENTADDVARGAKPLEVEGLAKPMAARVMSVGLGGQTLVTGDAIAAMGDLDEGLETVLHGHYRLKGVEEPVPLHEIGSPDEAPFMPPPDAPKAYRVVRLRKGAWVPASDVPNNLRGERDDFFGRDPELRELATRLLRHEQRLVTVLGPGGTGKSRLTLEFGRRWLGDWPGGSWFCELEEVSTAAELVGAIARTAGITIEGGDAVEWVGAVLAEREPTLFLLDNFEQLVDHAGVIGRWLDLAPNTAWVVSSRERLQLEGEHVIRLEALPVPEEGASPMEAMDSAAVQLFATRAAAVNDRFVLDASTACDVGDLVRLLDGMPLAIELAAARVTVMSPKKLVARMSQRFKLLSSGRRGVNRRQATLRGAIDWSWDLIEPWERLALAQCSVFRGGFTLEAAEAVLDLDAWPDAPWPMDVVQGLVDKSLLRTLDAGGHELRDLHEPLLGLYQSIRDYADEKLRDPAAVVGPDGEPLTGAGTLPALQLRHARHYGADVEERLEAARGKEGVDALAAVRENLVVAFEYALAQDEPGVAADCWVLHGALALRRGPVQPSWERFSRLDLDGLDAERERRCLDVQLELAKHHGDHDEDLAQRLVDHWVARGDEAKILQALMRKALCRPIPELDDAMERLGDRVRALNDPELLQGWLVNSSLALKGEASAARLEEVLAFDGRAKGMALYNLSLGAIGRRDFDGALAYLDRLDTWDAAGGSSTLIQMLRRFSWSSALLLAGRTEEAVPVVVEGMRLAEQLGMRRFIAASSQGLTLVHLHRGEVAEARRVIDRALKLQLILGDTFEIAWGQATTARVCLAEGDVPGARAMLDAAEATAPNIRRDHGLIANFIEEARKLVEEAEGAA